MKSSNMQMPGLRKRNLSAIPANRKNMARNPTMARMLEKNTT